MCIWLLVPVLRDVWGRGRTRREDPTEIATEMIPLDGRKAQMVTGERNFTLWLTRRLLLEVRYCVSLGAILMAVLNSFKMSFRLIRTREKTGKIKLFLFLNLD